jgi:hypothetical protein
LSPTVTRKVVGVFVRFRAASDRVALASIWRVPGQRNQGPREYDRVSSAPVARGRQFGAFSESAKMISLMKLR